jgi:hypothetical protein
MMNIFFITKKNSNFTAQKSSNTIERCRSARQADQSDFLFAVDRMRFYFFQNHWDMKNSFVVLSGSTVSPSNRKYANLA